MKKSNQRSESSENVYQKMFRKWQKGGTPKLLAALKRHWSGLEVGEEGLEPDLEVIEAMTEVGASYFSEGITDPEQWKQAILAEFAEFRDMVEPNLDLVYAMSKDAFEIDSTERLPPAEQEPTTEEESVMKTSLSERVIDRFVAVAADLIGSREFSRARQVLVNGLKTMPSGWRPFRGVPEGIQCAFWDQEEFSAYSDYYKRNPKGMILWVSPSYTRALCLVAAISIESENYEEAIEPLDQALAMEPDHPDLLCEKAYCLQQLKDYERALELYVIAEHSRPWAPHKAVARAIRGQGITLIDLARLDEAEDNLRRSLTFEPDSWVVENELNYIRDLRG